MTRSELLAFVLAAIFANGCAPDEPSPRVLILGLDGLDPQTVDLLMSEGKMPHFAELRDHGAYAPLRSQEPLLSPIIWTTIATGKGASEHGIGDFVATSSEGEQIPASSEQRRVKALWNIASEAGKRVATVGWWATWPPEQINGTVVSDHIAYHFLFEGGFGSGAANQAQDKTYPPELAARIAPYLRRPSDLRPEDLARYVDIDPASLEAGLPLPGKAFDFGDELSHFRWALATAHSYRDIGLELWSEDKPDLEMVYIEGTDSTSHLFGHLFRVDGLRGELAEQQKRFGRAVEEIYVLADELLGDYMKAMDQNTTLLVLSDHGFQLGQLHDDPSRARDLRRVSERFHRPFGILYVYGNGVRENVRINQPSILDIAPTVLSLLGMNPAEDMPGRVLSEIFLREPTSQRVPSYEDGSVHAARDPKQDAGPVAQAQLEHLKSLGYIADSSDSLTSQPGISATDAAERNLAAIAFRAGRYEDAEQSYRRLIARAPESSGLHASLAGVLGAQDRFDEALIELGRAIELEPLNVEAFHNRAVILERRGETETAIADYETALRYRPQYTPSRDGLKRLTGRTTVRAPRNDLEQRASKLVEQASQEARKTNYEQAMRYLDEAERLAPSYVVTYQYRSNVAYLMGDLEASIAALEKALEIEPGNALFKSNLSQLEAQLQER